MIKYKLTTQDNKTYNDTIWEVGKLKETNGEVKKLCTNSWLHFYHTPELAMFFNPIHANIESPKLWECEVEGEILDNDYGLKAGCTKMTLLKEIDKPELNKKDFMLISYSFVKELSKHNNLYKKNELDFVKRCLKNENSLTKKELTDFYFNGLSNSCPVYYFFSIAFSNYYCQNIDIIYNILIHNSMNSFYSYSVQSAESVAKIGNWDYIKLQKIILKYKLPLEEILDG